MNTTVGIDYTKMTMSELHLCQLAITKEIHARDQLSQIQLDDIIKQNQIVAAQLKEVAQKKIDAEHKTTTLMQALDKACRSLSDFDLQGVEEPAQRIAKLRDYAQQSRSEIDRLKTEHQHQIVELQLRIPPKTPPEAREQRHRDIKASVAKISDNKASVAKLLEDSIKAWVNLQDHPDVGKIQESIKIRQAELDAVII